MTDPQGNRDGFASRLMRSRRALLAVSLLVASLGECVAAADSKPAEAGTAETWQVIHLSGQRIGYSYAKTEAIQESETQVLRTVSESHMTIKRFGQSLVIQQTMETVETEAGDFKRTIPRPVRVPPTEPFTARNCDWHRRSMARRKIPFKSGDPT